MSKRYWCESAWLGGDKVTAGVLLDIEDDRITDISLAVASPPSNATQLSGVTIPALANAHSHAFHRALRGRTHGQRSTFWTWRDLMYRVAGNLDPDNYYRLARAAFAEMALAGVGVVGEFHYLHHQQCGSPYDDPNAMGIAVAAAAADVGIRLTLLDTLYLHGGLDPTTAGGYAPIRPEQARFNDREATSWAGRVDDLAGTVSNPTRKVGAAVHSVRAVDPASIETAAAWARQNNAPLHVHASEQPAENQQCLAVHECTPTELFAKAAGLGPNVTLVHATHTSDHDISLIGEAGANCCLCPTTERDLADGIGPAAALFAAGSSLCVGSDSNAVVDIFEETRAVELDQRTTTLERGVLRTDMLATMATAGGYRALGWGGGGTLEPGSLADFATVNLDSVRLAGTDTDNALASVIYAATSADVSHLVVAGEPVVVNGLHKSIDVGAELAAAIAEVTAQ